MVKVLIFTKIYNKNYEKIIKQLKKEHDPSYIDSIFSYYEREKQFLLYDENSTFTKEDFDLIAKYAKKTTTQVGILLEFNPITCTVSSIFFMEDKMFLLETEPCNNDEFYKRKDKFVESQKIDDRVIIKKELTEVFFKNLYKEPKLKEKGILDEVLYQIPICEDLCRGLTDFHIKNWLRCANAAQVAIKAKTHKFA